MRIDQREYRALPLRAHALLHDIPLEDVWVIPLAGGGAGRSIQEVRAVFIEATEAAPAIVKGLFRIRERIGAICGWDQPNPDWNNETCAYRLSPADRARSTALPGTPDGRLSFLYRFENEQLSEVRNATVHAFLSLSIRQTPGGCLAYLAVYVKPVHRLTRLYMLVIAPFRRLVVYPAMIRNVERMWAERYGEVRVSGVG